MKFEYDKEEDRGEVVAVISDTGNLVVRNTETGDFTIALCKAGFCHNAASVDMDSVVRKFYRGDKITITF